MSVLPAIGWAAFLPPSLPGFVLGSAFLVFTASRLSAKAPSPLLRIVGFGVWSAALLVGYAEILSFFRALHWPAALALCAGGALTAWRCLPVAGERLSEQIARVRAGIPRREAWELLVFAAPLLAWALFAVWLVHVSAEPLGDNVTYHLPRLAYWMQHQTLALFSSNDPRISTFPVVGNLLQLWPMQFLQRDRLCALIQLASHLGAALAVYAVARNLGAVRLGSATAALCWIAIPAALAQVITSNVDLIASFFAASSAALALACLRFGTGWTVWTCVVCAALLVGTKPQTLPVGLACALVALIVLRRSGRGSFRQLLPLVLLSMLLAGMQPMRNARATGSPAGLASVSWVVLNPSLPTLAKNAQLLALPLTGGAGFSGQFPPWTVREAFFEHGMGVVWLVATSVALIVVPFRRALRQPLPIGYTLLALGYAGSLLFALRHQVSVDRFFLPAAALLAPLVSMLVAGRARVALASAAWVLGCGALFSAAQGDIARRAPAYAGRFLRYSDVAGAEWHAVARACERLSIEGPGHRIGVVSSQSMMQRLLMGSSYRNVLVPLSHDPPASLSALDALRLDAFYLDVGGALRIQLFRDPWTPPPATRDRWQLSAREAFDEDFLTAYLAAVEEVSVEPTARLLGRAGSGWSLDPMVRANALFFVRRRTNVDALSIVHASSPYGVKEHDDHRVFWLGSERTLLKVFSAAAGPAQVTFRFESREPFAPGTEIEVRRASRPPTSQPLRGHQVEVPVTVRAGIDFISVRIIGPSSPRAAQLDLGWKSGEPGS